VPDADVNDVAGYGLIRYDHGKLNLLGGVRYDMRHIEAESYEKAGSTEEDTFILKNSGDTMISRKQILKKIILLFHFHSVQHIISMKN